MLTGAVNAAGLDGDEEPTTLLQEQLGVDTDNSGLIGLSNIGENDIDHREKHPVGHGLTSILDNTVTVRLASCPAGHLDRDAYGMTLVRRVLEKSASIRPARETSGSPYRHVDEISARTMRELDSLREHGQYLDGTPKRGVQHT